jgi:hypothetical protein
MQVALNCHKHLESCFQCRGCPHGGQRPCADLLPERGRGHAGTVIALSSYLRPLLPNFRWIGCACAQGMVLLQIRLSEKGMSASELKAKFARRRLLRRKRGFTRRLAAGRNVRRESRPNIYSVSRFNGLASPHEPFRVRIHLRLLVVDCIETAHQSVF